MYQKIFGDENHTVPCSRKNKLSEKVSPLQGRDYISPLFCQVKKGGTNYVYCRQTMPFPYRIYSREGRVLLGMTQPLFTGVF